MKLLPVILSAIIFALTGCDTSYGVSRSGRVHKLPDFPRLKAQIEHYPEIKEVKFWQSEGGRPLTLTGIQKPEEVYYLNFTDYGKIHGILMFTQEYTGKVSYSQYLIYMNGRPPQPWVDASWPVMKKIEDDLIHKFDLPELRTNVKCATMGVKDPDRKMGAQQNAPADSPSGL